MDVLGAHNRGQPRKRRGAEARVRETNLVERYGEKQVGLLTGDNAINGDAPVVVMTTEVLRNMLYAGSQVLDGLGYVVMDEVHYLADRFRGAVWEEVIIHLPDAVQLVSLSATVSNAERECCVPLLGVVSGAARPVGRTSGAGSCSPSRDAAAALAIAGQLSGYRVATAVSSIDVVVLVLVGDLSAAGRPGEGHVPRVGVRAGRTEPREDGSGHAGAHNRRTC